MKTGRAQIRRLFFCHFDDRGYNSLLYLKCPAKKNVTKLHKQTDSNDCVSFFQIFPKIDNGRELELGHVDQARSTWDGMKDKDKGSNASYETKSPIIPKLNNFTSPCTPSKSSF